MFSEEIDFRGTFAVPLFVSWSVFFQEKGKLTYCGAGGLFILEKALESYLGRVK